jgi:hypothetical protein
LVKKHEFIFNPANGVMSKLKSEMENYVKDSNGFFKLDLFEDNGTRGNGRYPKRSDKRRKINPEDKSIYVGGMHVGYLQSTVPWLNPDTWKGLGLKLDTIPVSAKYFELKKEAEERLTISQS